jgi:hypothetical protein
MRKTVFPVLCFIFAILLGVPDAVYAPDAGQYRLLALGHRGAVPAPFSFRVLGPAIAGLLGHVTGRGVDAGFLTLGVISLAALIALVGAILWSWRPPLAVLAGIFLMPFWVDIFHDYYLPDLLHATILAAMLYCLLRGQTTLALLLLLPAYLARESTMLVALCLIVACWRRIPLRAALAGIAAMIAAILLSKHFGQSNVASAHGLGGGAYMGGKLVWSFFKNVLGLPLYSNTLPECAPIWTTSLRHPLGSISTIGVCRPSSWGPGRLLLAWFGIFGIGPALALAFGRKIISQFKFSDLPDGTAILLRFCLVYGVASILITPLLGASGDRLVEYGWPFYFVVLPWFLVAQHIHLRATWVLPLHLATCWMAWYAFRLQAPSVLLPGLTALALNGFGYILVKRDVRS